MKNRLIQKLTQYYIRRIPLRYLSIDVREGRIPLEKCGDAVHGAYWDTDYLLEKIFIIGYGDDIIHIHDFDPQNVNISPSEVHFAWRRFIGYGTDVEFLFLRKSWFDVIEIPKTMDIIESFLEKHFKHGIII